MSGENLVNKSSQNRKGKLFLGHVTKHEMYVHLFDGKTEREIAEYYGVSRTAVSNLLKRYEITKPRVRSVDSYFKMKKYGLNDLAIADIWGIGISSLSSWKAREELEKLSLQYFKEEGELVPKLIIRGELEI